MPTIILDTDIGTDVDDILALGLALRSPEIQLAAVTVVYGDVDLRARMVASTLAAAGRSDIPLGRGIGQPLLRQRAVYWAGHEGGGLLDGSEPAPATVHAVDLIRETVRAHPGEVTLVPVGPLTNLAAAVIMDADIVPLVKEVVMMGGLAGRRHDQSFSPAEHNIACDPEAAAIVFGAGWPITMVGLDVTTRVTLRRDHLPPLAARAAALTRILADQAGRYMDLRGRDFTYLHDPLAVAAVVDRDLVQTQPMHVTVELHGRHTAGATVVRPPSAEQPANALVCLDVDAERAVSLFLERVSA